MTINLAGTAIQDVRVAGVQAQRVMLGTGSTAVEVWSAGPTVIYTQPFSGSPPYSWTNIASWVSPGSGRYRARVTGHTNNVVYVEIRFRAANVNGPTTELPGTGPFEVESEWMQPAAGVIVYLQAVGAGGTVSGTFVIEQE